MTILACNIFRNGRGVHIGSGGGIYVHGATLTVAEGTIIAGNEGDRGGGIYVHNYCDCVHSDDCPDDEPCLTNRVTIEQSMIRENTAWEGGGVYIEAASGSAHNGGVIIAEIIMTSQRVAAD